MNIEIELKGKKYKFTTSNDSISDKIDIDFDNIPPHVVNYLKQELEDSIGAYGKTVSYNNMTNLDLIDILSKKGLLINHSPEINAPESTKNRLF